MNNALYPGQAGIELSRQLSGIKAVGRTDSYNLRARHLVSPLIYFTDLGSPSYCLQRETGVRRFSSEDDSFAAVNGRRKFLAHHLAQRFK